MEEPLGAVGHVLGQGGPTALVDHGGDHARRLVQGEGHLRGVQLDPGPVDVEDRGGRVDAGPQRGDDLAVDRHPAAGDEVLAHAARPHSRVGHDFLQALAARHVRVAHRSPLRRRRIRVPRETGRRRREFGGRGCPSPRGNMRWRRNGTRGGGPRLPDEFARGERATDEIYTNTPRTASTSSGRLAAMGEGGSRRAGGTRRNPAAKARLSPRTAAGARPCARRTAPVRRSRVRAGGRPRTPDGRGRTA